MSFRDTDKRAVLFVDVSGSTAMFAEVGDAIGRQVISECLDAWSRIVAEFRGQVVQARGDGLLCIFSDTQQAVSAAIRVRDLQRGQRISMHAGVHFGSCIREDQQLYGDTVNTASRICDLATVGEIAVSESARLQLRSAETSDLRLIPRVPLKGKPDPVNIFLVTEPAADVTDYCHVSDLSITNTRLELRYIEDRMVVNDANPECIIGRSSDCHMVVDTNVTSRKHVTIQCRIGKFYLQDHSTNGTYVEDGDNVNAILLHREFVQLKAHGTISLGCKPHQKDRAIISFAVRI